MKIKIIAFLFILFTFSNILYSQTSTSTDLTYEVNRVYPYISITKETLNKAESINDFKHAANDRNLSYDAAWVKEFISVEILTSHQGQIKSAKGNDGILTKEQKKMMRTADTGSDIKIKVKYIPENTLSYNDPKELEFTFSVDPESEATYPDGLETLKKYLKEKAITHIPDGSFEGYDLTAVKFTISEEGEILNPHIFGGEYQKDRDEVVDNLLVETIRNMPCWKPATYADGTTVKQDFVLTVGNMENCIIPMLGISRK